MDSRREEYKEYLVGLVGNEDSSEGQAAKMAGRIDGLFEMIDFFENLVSEVDDDES